MIYMSANKEIPKGTKAIGILFIIIFFSEVYAVVFFSQECRSIIGQ